MKRSMSPCGHSVARPYDRTRLWVGDWDADLSAAAAMSHTACLRGKARLTCTADIGNRTSKSSRGCGRAEGPQLDRAPLFV